MSESSAQSGREDFYQTVQQQLDGVFKNVSSDLKNAVRLLQSGKTESGKYFERHSRLITGLEAKISQVLELCSYEQDYDRSARTAVDLSKEIPLIVQSVLKAAPERKTVIETRFSSGIPSITVHRQLLLKWLFWCINRLFHEKSVSHIIIEVRKREKTVEIHIRPDKTKGDVEDIWTGFDWLCANHYFYLEDGSLSCTEDKSVIGVIGITGSETHGAAHDAQIESAHSVIEKIRNGIDLPTLSPVGTKIIHMALDDSTSAQDIAEVITLDPALTSKVLKVVNSSMYGFSKEITTLSQAVAMLGMNAIRTLSLGISVVNAFPVGVREDFDYTRFWERSIASAIASRLTAKRLKNIDSEEAFICGLIQNIGSLVLANYFPAQYGMIMNQHYEYNQDLVELELKMWGVDHSKVGYEVFSQWKMPKILTESILYHHDPDTEQENGKTLSNLIKIAYLSDLCATVLYEQEKGKTLPVLKKEYKSLFDLDEAAVDEIMETVSGETLGVAQEFDLKINQVVDYTEIMQSANIKLQMINLDYEQINRELLTAKNKAEKLAAELQKANTQLEELALTDGLTGLYNHRFFYEMLQKEYANSSRHNLPLGALMLDIDYFKKINDTFGHQEGDKILQGVGKLLKSTLRHGDYAARYGGEEFALLLPNTDMKESILAAERIRKLIEKTAFTKKIAKGKVTISAGVSCLVDNNYANYNTLIEAADQALYKAKGSGRNRVVSA
ncbi:HDOD domain-containing protein [candidate division KSB1 bacterium]